MASCLILAVSGCATQPDRAEIDPEVQQARLQALDAFSFKGGLGIWTDEQSLPARIQWQQQGKRLTVQLSGPLGIGNLKLVSGDPLSTLSRSGTVISEGESIDTVLQQGLGLEAPIPVAQLQQWVTGLPGNANSIVRDAQGKLSSLRFTDEQGTSWQARFLKYTDVDGTVLPSLITASGGPYSVRLVLKDWQLSVLTSVPQPSQSNRRLAIPDR